VARIKWTGYQNVEDLEIGDHDPNSKTGLTQQGYNAWSDSLVLSDLEDLEAELVRDEG
jgi:hypothetical protein